MASNFEAAPASGRSHHGHRKPLKMIAKFFNKGKRTASVPEVNVMTSPASGPSISDLVLVDTELEALHLSRTDNPYLQLLSSQDNLDFNPDLKSMCKDGSLMSPESISPTRSYGGGKEYSLSEIHSHLIRSPPPISWPQSPRSNGTFSPDSSDGMMDVDLNPGPVHPIVQPVRGYSPYNRSHSEEHILDPCRELLKSAEFSPVRGTTPELLGMSMNTTAVCISPYRDYDVRSERKMRANDGVNRTASFASTSQRQQHFSGSTSLRNASQHTRYRSSNFYYTMNYSQEDDLDEGLLSPNKNQLSSYNFGSRSCRRSIGGLSLSPMSMSLTGPPSAPVQHNNGKSGGGIFSSWRRSYRMRSKSTAASSAHNNARKKDAKSMENLLSDDRPVPRYSLDYEDELDFDNN